MLELLKVVSQVADKNQKSKKQIKFWMKWNAALKPAAPISSTL